jgi:hypothetical protein
LLKVVGKRSSNKLEKLKTYFVEKQGRYQKIVFR